MTQPQDGDIVLHCGHVDNGPHHFFKASMWFKPPGSRTKLNASWIIQCKDCMKSIPMKPKPEDFTIAAHDTWVGDDPVMPYPMSNN